MKKVFFTIKYVVFIIIFHFFVFTPVVYAQNFTQEDRARIVRLEEKMNNLEKRFNELKEYFDQKFEDSEKRFESMDKRFESMQNFLIVLISILGGMIIALMGMLFWDRKTFLIKAKQEIVKEIQEIKGKYIIRVINALKDLAKHDARVMEILKKHHLL